MKQTQKILDDNTTFKDDEYKHKTLILYASTDFSC